MIEDSSARTEAIRMALEAYDHGPAKRNLEVEIRGKKVLLPVVTLNPAVLLLNNNNARLNAQLVDHSKKDEVFKNPTSIESQQVIDGLLRATDKYKDLRAQLKEVGQQNPGVVTRDGLLVNGNTRVVALRELGVLGVDVAILPVDANSEDLLEIEMSLQMTRLVHQDYTFTNELLLMSRYVKSGHTEQQLGSKMGWMRNGKKKVEQRLRILHIIEEVRWLCDAYLPYHVFDSKEEHLKDLDKEYQQLKSTGDVAAAESMKWSRITAIFLGVNKDQVRTIDDYFFEEQVGKRVTEGTEAKNALESVRRVVVDDGLDDVLEPPESDGERLDMKMFVKNMLNDSETRDSNGGIGKDLNGAYAGVAQAVRLATDQKVKQERWANYLVEPSAALRDVQLSVLEIIEKFGEVSAKQQFNFDNFKFELGKVEQAVKKLGVLVDNSRSLTD